MQTSCFTNLKCLLKTAVRFVLLHVSVYLWVIIVLESSDKTLETMRNIPVSLAVTSDCCENNNSTSSVFLLSTP